MANEVPFELTGGLKGTLSENVWRRGNPNPYEYFYYEGSDILARRQSPVVLESVIKAAEAISDLSDPDKIRDHYNANLETLFHAFIESSIPEFDNVYNNALQQSGFYRRSDKKSSSLDYASLAWLRTACDFLTSYHFSLGDGKKAIEFVGDTEVLTGIVTVYDALRSGKAHIEDENKKYDPKGISFKKQLGVTVIHGQDVNIYASCPAENYGRDWFFTAKKLVDDSISAIEARMKKMHMNEESPE